MKSEQECREAAMKLELPQMWSTRRLSFRIVTREDADELYEALCEDWTDFLLWMPWAKNGIPPKSVTVDFANKALSRFKAREDLSFVLREQHQVVGTCSVPRLAWEVPVFEIGYWLRASARGRGLMTEAVIGLRDYLVQYCNPLRLEIRCDSANAASRSVAVRTGFLEEATIRKSRRNNQGKLADETIYAWFPEEITEVNR